MKKLILLLAITAFIGCSKDELNGCPTIKSYHTYGEPNAKYAVLTLSDGTIVTKPFQIVEKQVGGSDLIGKEFCQ